MVIYYRNIQGARVKGSGVKMIIINDDELTLIFDEVQKIYEEADQIQARIEALWDMFVPKAVQDDTL